MLKQYVGITYYIDCPSFCMECRQYALGMKQLQRASVGVHMAIHALSQPHYNLPVFSKWHHASVRARCDDDKVAVLLSTDTIDLMIANTQSACFV